MASPIPAEAKTQSTKAAIANEKQNAPLFSFNYRIDSGKSLAFGGSAQPLPGGANIALVGRLSDEGNIAEAIPWFATLEGEGKIRWAAQLGAEHHKDPAELTNRENQVIARCQTGENQVIVAKFVAQSMVSNKGARVDLAPMLNSAVTELLG